MFLAIEGAAQLMAHSALMDEAASKYLATEGRSHKLLKRAITEKITQYITISLGSILLTEEDEPSSNKEDFYYLSGFSDMCEHRYNTALHKVFGTY